MLAGLEAAKPGDSPMDEHRHRLDQIVGKREGEDLYALENVVWPQLVTRVQALVQQPTKLRDVLKAAARAGELGAGDVLRGLEILVAAGLVAWK
jgi:hypothetical protein